jgi:hypothetical protein
MMSLIRLSAPKASLGQQERVAAPCVVVIFGASGDLARRKLLPAFYNLAKKPPSAGTVRNPEFLSALPLAAGLSGFGPRQLVPLGENRH